MRDHSMPIVCRRTWQTVMEAARGRCQCPGTCGHAHARNGTPCAQNRFNAILSIASPDLTLSVLEAARVPVAELLVWCEGCRRATTTAQRRAKVAATPSAPALFDLDDPQGEARA